MTPEVIAAEIARAVERLERDKQARVIDAARYQKEYAENPKNWSSPPASPETMAGVYDRMIATERKRSALVKVVRQGGEFYLDYGDEHLTGPFICPENAEGWFLGGGR